MLTMGVDIGSTASKAVILEDGNRHTGAAGGVREHPGCGRGEGI